MRAGEAGRSRHGPPPRRRPPRVWQGASAAADAQAAYAGRRRRLRCRSTCTARANPWTEPHILKFPAAQAAPLPDVTRRGELDLQAILDAWNEATDRLQQTHEALRAEVRRLTDELEAKNRELARQEPPGRPGTDGLARGPRGAQQPGADEALSQPAAAADQRRLPAAWTCSTKSPPALPPWRRPSATCCTSPATASRSG